MTRDEIEAERVRFYELFPLPKKGPLVELGIQGERQKAWLARAEIARAEQAELRERVRELARDTLRVEFECAWEQGFSAQEQWERCSKRTKQLAEEAGVWFDDDGNDVPLDKWRARMGGAG